MITASLDYCKSNTSTLIYKQVAAEKYSYNYPLANKNYCWKYFPQNSFLIERN